MSGAARLVTFEEVAPGEAAAVAPPETSIEPVVREIEDELQRTRDQLRSTIEQYETSLRQVLRLALRTAPVVVLSLDGEQRVTWGFAHGKELAGHTDDTRRIFAPGHAERLARISRA